MPGSGTRDKANELVANVVDESGTSARASQSFVPFPKE